MNQCASNDSPSLRNDEICKSSRRTVKTRMPYLTRYMRSCACHVLFWTTSGVDLSCSLVPACALLVWEDGLFNVVALHYAHW